MPNPTPPSVDTEVRTRVLLLVEDNPADVFYISELIEQAGLPPQSADTYRIIHASRLDDAVRILGDQAVDVVLLDLRLPDASGVDTVKSVREVTTEVPVVDLTGIDDESVGLACIDAGAQDYLCKADIRGLTLRRAIGYAITRIRETQLRELRETLASYRALASPGTSTSVTAAIAGSGVIRERYPEVFSDLSQDYVVLLNTYFKQLASGQEKPREVMIQIVSALGDRSAGPRDLLDLHMTALEATVKVFGHDRAHFVVVEGRLFALEMMGMLVDYYRVGSRSWAGRNRGFR